MTAPTFRQLLTWLLRVTRPVLPPLLVSTLFRIADQLAGIGLFTVGVYAVVASLDPRGQVSLLAVLSLMLGLSLLKAALRYGEQFLGHLVAFKALEILRAEIFHALIPRSPRASLTTNSGDLLTRATKDVDRIEVFFAHTFAPVVSAVVVPCAIVGIVACKVSGALAALLAAGLILALVCVPLAGKQASLRAERASAGARSALTAHVTDSVQGISEILSYGQVEARLQATTTLGNAVLQAARPSIYWAALRHGLTALLVLILPVLLLLVGGGYVAAGRVSVAALAATLASAVRLSETARSLEELAASFAAARASSERVYALVHAPIEIPDGTLDLPAASPACTPANAAPTATPAAAPALPVTWAEVTYTYPGAKAPALTNVSFSAAAGKWTCLVGVSGSGKTTLAQLALRFDQPSAGAVKVAGIDVRQLRAASLYQQVALVTQKAHLLRASIADNVRLGCPDASDTQVERACKIAAIHAEIMAMPGGYNTLVGERGNSLSGGQRQRLALARALLTNPRVLILDEFTSHLDPTLDEVVRRQVQQWAQGKTVIEITHRLWHLDQADQVVVLDRGRVVQAGTSAQLAAVAGPLRQLLARQSACPVAASSAASAITNARA